MTRKETIQNGVSFVKRTSGDVVVYDNEQSPSNMWSGYIPPSSFKGELPDSFSFETAVESNGYFVFALQEPTTEQLPEFVAYVCKNVPTSDFNNIQVVWVSQADGAYSIAKFISLNESNKKIIVSQSMTYNIEPEFAFLFIQNNTVVNLIPAEAPTQFEFVLESDNMNFGSAIVGSESLFDGNLSILFADGNIGAFKFPLGLNLSADYKAFHFTNYFYYKDSNASLKQLTYPVFKTQSDNLFALTQASICPIDVVNKSGLNTYFAFTGETYNSKSKQKESGRTTLPSYFSTNCGYAISLLPKSDFSVVKGLLNSDTPSINGARFVISPYQNSERSALQFQLGGDFYLSPDGGLADQHQQYDLMPGLSGTENIAFTPYSSEAQSGDTIYFEPMKPGFAPNFPAQELSLVSPGAYKPTLTDEYYTTWANVVTQQTKQVAYASQAEGASLFAKNHGVSDGGVDDLLGFFEPTVNMPNEQSFSVPMVPYLAVTSAVNKLDTPNYNLFESQVISKHRKYLISKEDTPSILTKSVSRKLANTAEKQAYSGTSLITTNEPTVATTPQGLITQVTNSGTWELLNLGQNTSTEPVEDHYVVPKNLVTSSSSPYQLSFVNLKNKLRNAFTTNQQFLVVTENKLLGKLFSTSGIAGGTAVTEAMFNNQMFIEGWPFDLNVGENNTYANYANVMIFKFCKGTLADRVKNPATWTQGPEFNTSKVKDPNESHQQLVAISSWIQQYLLEAEEAEKVGEENPDTNQKILFENFNRIVNDENWNGILVLKANIDLQEFPQELKGLISGIDLTQFNAHHVGIEMNKVQAQDAVQMEPKSSIFGLINYLDPVYQQQLLQNQNPEKPIPTPEAGDYDFRVLQLQVLFQNTAIKFFQSKVQLTMNNLFSDAVIGTNNPYGGEKLNAVVLNGTYQDHNGTPVYVFENAKDNLFYFDSNLLKNVEVTKVQFNTLTTDPTATEIQSRFSMWGYLNFGEVGEMDIFSFGIEDNKVPIHGLNYSGMYVNMHFNLATPTIVHYGFDASQISFNSNLSNARKESLYPNFALQVDNLVIGNSSNSPRSQGFLPIQMPQATLSVLSGDWYGLQMTLNMGTPGELAASLDFNASLLLAWSPGGKASDTSYKAFIGIVLPGTSSNAKLLSLQGILKLSIQDLTLSKTEHDDFVLALSNIALKFLGILKLPPGGDTNFLLFGNPNKGATAKSLGWYASYNKTS